jgi:branched-chain amino acid transport system substrate-binding protein
VERAVEIVNDEGGVLGSKVRLVIGDEGADASTAATALELMVEQRQVDAIIGPASSRIALSVLDQVVSAGVLSCSPAATSIRLSQFPDQGLFFRTIPSDALQAQALAQLVDQTGLGQVALTYPDDVYGQAFAEAVRSALAALAIEVLADVPYDPQAEVHTEEVAAVLGVNPPVVALIGDNDVGVRMVTELIDAAGSPTPLIVTNDAVRRPAQPALLAALTSAQRARIKGVAPTVLPQSTDLLDQFGLVAGDPSTAFASQAIDCVNLIALAAIQAQSDQPTAVANALNSVSRGGSSCRDFPTCAALLDEGRNIDYDGFEGLVRLDSNGDVTVGRFERFSFDADGIDVVEVRFDVGATG